MKKILILQKLSKYDTDTKRANAVGKTVLAC